MLRTLLLLSLLVGSAQAVEWSPYAAGGINSLIATSEARPAGGRPLLVIMHGCAQSNAALQQDAIAAAADTAGGIVALPSVPFGGVLAGCWDYYGAGHTDANRHLGPLIAHVEALVADEALGIDPAQVWIAGLSSGAGEAMVAGCVAPDLFSGVISVGGPGLGTEAGQIGLVATNAEAVTGLCARLSRAPAAFARQRAIFVVGTSDYVVAQGYAPVNADGFAAMYGAGERRDADLAALPGAAAGQVALWRAGGSDRVALLTATGLDHAWPLGNGAGITQQFVAQGGPDVATYAFEFFGGAAPDRPGEPEPQPVVEPEPAGEPEPGAPEPEPDDAEPEAPCSVQPRRVDGTLIDHVARFAVHAGGYGAVDVSYVDLLSRYGTATPFPLYEGPDGWYADPDRVPSACDAPPAEAPEPEQPAPEGTEPDAAQPEGAPFEGCFDCSMPQEKASSGCAVAAPGRARDQADHGPAWLALLMALGIIRRR